MEYVYFLKCSENTIYTGHTQDLEERLRMHTKGENEFFGLKLHCVINERGEILAFVLTPGNMDDRMPLTGSNLLSRIHGKLFGDRGYVSQSLFEQLFNDGIHLITKIRNNMKNSLMLTTGARTGSL